MAADLSTVGLPNQTSWTSTTGFTAVSGTQRLFTNPAGPAGVLYKRVSNLGEALECGGLFLYDLNAPGRWLFLVGRSLVKDIQARQIGTVASLKTYWANLRRIREWDGHLYGYQEQTQTVSVDRVAVGGVLMPSVEATAYFDAGRSVGLMGIVTGATDGRGQSHSVSSGFGAGATSYMSSHVPMSVPLAKFLRDTKMVTVEAAPESVRGIYLETFEAALAAVNAEKKHPTLSVTTVWDGVEEIGIPRIKMMKLFAEGAAGTPFTGTPFPTQPTLTYDDSLAPPTSSGTIANGWGPPYAPDAVPVVHSTLIFPGYTGAQGSEYDDYILSGTLVSKPGVEIMPKQTGTVENLNVGYLRDHHVLGRSLVGGLRYATEPPSHEKLAALVIESMDQISGDTARPDRTGPVLAKEDDASRVLASSGAARGASFFSKAPAFQQGTLIEELYAFSSTWDRFAENRALG